MTTSNTRPPAPSTCPRCDAPVQWDATGRFWKYRPADTGEPRDNLFASAKDAQAEVASWPKWKQEAAARARVTVPQDERAVACNVHVDSDVYCRFGTQGCNVHEPPGGVVSAEEDRTVPPWADEFEGTGFVIRHDSDPDDFEVEFAFSGEVVFDTFEEAAGAVREYESEFVDAILNRGRAGALASVAECARYWAGISDQDDCILLTNFAIRIERGEVPECDALSKALAAARREAEQERDEAYAHIEGLRRERMTATAALEQRVAELWQETVDDAAQIADLKEERDASIARVEAAEKRRVDAVTWREVADKTAKEQRARADKAEAERDEWKERSELQFIALEMTRGERAERDAFRTLLVQCEPVFVQALDDSDALVLDTLRTLLTNIRRALGKDNT